ncbi:ABC transporter permease [Glaciibacter superstes]|uniref:ABC transporter permease n=1 Tax=Glaciibacter superstes TaxID=501023 RepID=UPI0003B3DF33|nr:ABC transporter permease [Glaciibacter superstes]
MSNNTLPTDQTGATILPDPRQETVPRRIGAFFAQPVVIVWIIFVLMFPLSRIVSPSFPSLGQLESTLILGLFLVVVAFGQGFVILTGGFDLSLPQTIALGAFLTGYLANTGWPVMGAIVAATIGCALIGLINGLLVAYAKFPPFIVTLATGSILGSVLLGVSRGTPAQPSPAALSSLFSGKESFLGIPTPIWALVIFALIAYLIQMRSTIGRRTFAVGNSEIASRVAGVPVSSTLIIVYTFAGISSGLAGIMLLGYSSGADLNIGASWLLPSITAVVVGGSAIRGGAGSYAGTIGGALLITVLGIDISAAGFSEGVKQILYGVIILIALIAARLGKDAGAART